MDVRSLSTVSRLDVHALLLCTSRPSELLLLTWSLFGRSLLLARPRSGVCSTASEPVAVRRGACGFAFVVFGFAPVSYTHLRAHETLMNL
eukprot:2046686-Prymnesium_polylepis.1